MPKRVTPLVNKHYYHVYNRGTNKQTIFFSTAYYKRALKALWFYRYANTGVSLSRYLHKMSYFDREKRYEELTADDNRVVGVVAYCLMPNHFHLIVRQNQDNGISKYVGNFQNSYTKYVNSRRKSQGRIFGSRFKSVLINNDEQMRHVIRYVLLNPYSSSLIRFVPEIQSYPYSSFREYNSESKFRITDTTIDTLFNSESAFKQFVFDNAEYQRNLKLRQRYNP